MCVLQRSRSGPKAKNIILNSTEHEFSIAQKGQMKNVKDFACFKLSDAVFILLISVTRGPDSLKRSPDLLNNVKIGQDQLRLIMKHILFNGGCGHFGQVT